VDASSIGKSRAEVTRELLNELNALVSSDALQKDPVELINENPNFFTKYTLVIASNLPEEPLLKLAKTCSEHHVAVLYVRSYGLIGQVRLVLPEHAVVESKPDNPADDLRIANPFPALESYADSIDMSKMDSTEHSHTAYVIILLKYFKKWREEHGGKMPSSYAEKNEFRNIVIKGSKKHDEENFNEAYKSALKASAPYSIPSNIRDILNDPKTAHLTNDSSNFWILSHALKGFVENEGGSFLPLPGSISDMTSTTDGYIKLQTLYQKKALEDVAAVTIRVKEALKQIGRPVDSITDEEIKVFCKNSNFLKVIRYRTLEDERNPKTAKSSMLASQLESPETSLNVSWYFMLRGVDRFFTLHGRYPGSDDSTISNDEHLLHDIIKGLLSELSITSTIEEKYTKEIVRCGAAELHPISSFLGGVASQEVIKTLTHMYTPVNNTFIFNGMNSTSLSFEV